MRHLTGHSPPCPYCTKCRISYSDPNRRSEPSLGLYCKDSCCLPPQKSLNLLFVCFYFFFLFLFFFCATNVENELCNVAILGLGDEHPVTPHPGERGERRPGCRGGKGGLNARVLPTCLCSSRCCQHVGRGALGRG